MMADRFYRTAADEDRIAARTSQLGRFSKALAIIARGRPDGGRPLSGEAARQLARHVLTAEGVDWSKANG